MITMGVESSCDETSVAILRDGRVLSSLTHSQEEHAVYGGVVPEVASRAHLERIDGLAAAAMERCGIGPKDIGLIAVTDSPGLAGALLVGVSFAIGMHTAHGIPITGVNHLEGHICSLFIDTSDGIDTPNGINKPDGVNTSHSNDTSNGIDTPNGINTSDCINTPNGTNTSGGINTTTAGANITPPFIVLLASGGHTAIYKYASFGDCELLGRTVDDAAGEAFDKVGKLLGFPYPAGRAIEQEAAKAPDQGRAGITFPVARFSDPGKRYCFSFSGLKTAVKNFISKSGEHYINDNRPALCAAFQQAVVSSLVCNVEAAAADYGIKTAAIAGGVACNGFLRSVMRRRLGDGNVVCPPPGLCTDNGAMIAMAGQLMYENNRLRFPNMDPGRGI
jgi:N6-L-threonylcarbamoyladenine synthase